MKVCHLDRSVAKRRDLQCASTQHKPTQLAVYEGLSSRPERSEAERSAVRLEPTQTHPQLAVYEGLSSRPERSEAERSAVRLASTQTYPNSPSMKVCHLDRS